MGGEFLNAKVQYVFAKYNINYYSTYNSVKANKAEKCIRTIKNKIFRYLTENKKDIYINSFLILYAVETDHYSIGLAPIEVNFVSLILT